MNPPLAIRSIFLLACALVHCHAERSADPGGDLEFEGTSLFDASVVELFYESARETNRLREQQLPEIFDDSELELFEFKPFATEAYSIRNEQALRDAMGLDEDRHLRRLRALDPETFFNLEIASLRDREFMMGTYDPGQVPGTGEPATFTFRQILNLFEKLGGSEEEAAEEPLAPGRP